MFGSENKGAFYDLLSGNNDDELINLPIDLVDPDPNQDRNDWDSPSVKNHLEEMKVLVGRDGVRRPIEVFKKNDRFIIIAGEVRWRASLANGITFIPAIVRKNLSEEKLSLDQLSENLTKLSLKPITLANAFDKRMKLFGWSQQQLALKIGKSKTYVSRRLSLLNMPDDVKNLAIDEILIDPEELLKISKLSNEDRKFVIDGLRDKTLQLKSYSKALKNKNNLKIGSDEPTTTKWENTSTTKDKKIRKRKVHVSYDNIALILNKYTDYDKSLDDSDLLVNWEKFIDNINA